MSFLFTGEYTQKMDTKGRTIVPAKFREELGTSVVVTKERNSVKPSKKGLQ